MAETTDGGTAALEWIQSIVSSHRGRRWGLIPILHEIQHAVGYIPPQAIPLIAGELGLFPSQVQGVITFYTQFYTAPRGQTSSGCAGGLPATCVAGRLF